MRRHMIRGGGIQQTWTSAYDPALKFSGKERDTESGLDYFGARYYDHSLYRFLSVDPVIPVGRALSNPQRWNLYGYCGNNPVKYVDPDGNTYIIFIKQEQKLYIYDKDNILWGIFDASNNVANDRRNIKGFPNGKWAFKEWLPLPDANSWDSMDFYGRIAFDFGEYSVYARYRLHSGRDMSFDGFTGGIGNMQQMAASEQLGKL